MEWLSNIPEDLTIEQDGVAVPAREHPFVKESPDLGHFVKRALDAHREVGARIPVKIEKIRDEHGRYIPKKESVEDWKKNHMGKLYEAGVLEAPPATPDDYQITKPENLPDGLTWNDDNVKKLASVLHKHGIPKSAVPELLELHKEALLGTIPTMKATYDDALLRLKREFGEKYDERAEQAKRLTKEIFKSEEEVEFFEKTGIGNHPAFLSVLMRLAPLAAQDSSILPSGSMGVSGDADAVRAELADIMNNPNNPRHKLYHAGDKATNEYIDGLYKKVYPGTVTIS